MITCKTTPVSNFASLVHAYSDADLASPLRSTVPLLAYWQTLHAQVPAFASIFGLPLAGPTSLEFEYTVPVQHPTPPTVPPCRGTPSHTDLMLLTDNQAVAVEAKYTEPPYQTVAEWLGSPPSSNKQQVLEGWLKLIESATGIQLTVGCVGNCTYQMIHRTASACFPTGKTMRSVVYQYFDLAPINLANNHQVSYYQGQLRNLTTLLHRPKQLRFYLVVCPLHKTPQFLSLEAQWLAGKRKLSAQVKRELIAGSLFTFGSPINVPI